MNLDRSMYQMREKNKKLVNKMYQKNNQNLNKYNFKWRMILG